MILLLNLLVFVTPLLFSFQNSELFELPKTYFVYIIAISIIVLHLKKYLTGQAALFHRSPLTLPLLLFLASQTVSTVFSIDIHTSFFGYYSRLNGGLLSIIVYILLALIIPLYINTDNLPKLIKVTLTSGFLVALYGIFQHFGIDKHLWIQDVQSRVFSTLGQPNWLAAYLCILLPIAIGNFLKAKSFIHKSYFILLTSSFYLSLLFTKSKSGLIAAAISLAIYFIFNVKKENLLKLFTVYCLLVTFSLTVNNPIKDKFFPPQLTTDNLRSDIPTTDKLNITPSEDIRKIVWEGSLKLAKIYPLFGTGPETFGFAYYWTRPASHNLTSEWDFLYNKAHNEYLNYLSTSGIIGLLTYLILIFVSLKILLRSKSYDLFSAYCSILITNFFGFSVVIISLFFFILPQLATLAPHTTSKPKKIPFGIPLLIALFLIYKVTTFFVADLAYAKSETKENQNSFSEALNFIKISLNFRPNEPVYLIKLGEITAKLALTQKSSDYAGQSISATTQALTVSPYSLNLWKQRAQIYYYLSGLDSKYYLDALESLHQAAKLAPTDAKTFYMLGEFYQNIKESDTAITYFLKALSLKPNYDHAAFTLGQIYLNQKKYESAKEMFQLVLSIAPKNQDAIKYLQSL